MLNRVLLIGNLTRDPEVRYLPSGMAVATFTIAVNERFKDRNGEMREEVLFIRVDTFQRLAENCAQYLKKGSRAFVEGKLKMNSWEKDGVKHQRIDVLANNVQFLDPRAAAASAEGAATAASGPGPASAGGQRPAPRQSAPARVAKPDVVDQPPAEEFPEQDMNANSYDAGPEETGRTNDDLPF